jgi:two-component system response regulator AtoC
LITGETGTGKDVVARLLHRKSKRNIHSFVKVNCPALPQDLLESELFGYEKGAFTGARTPKPGRFELADKGTIFLDEIGEISENVQAKLMQVLDGEPFMRIGGTKPVHSSARVVAATNIDIEQAVQSGRLREDIAYRLSELAIPMVALRDRPSDIPVLAEHFNYNYCKRLDKEYAPIDASVVRRMREMHWPGNVRELAARVKQYVATSDELILLEESSRVVVRAREMGGGSNGGAHALQSREPERKFESLKEAARKAVEETEKKLIEDALRYTLWNRRKAAKLLDISYSSLLRRIEAYEIGKA